MKYLAVVAAVVAVIGALRWWLLSTRMKRHRRQQAEAADPAGRPIEARLIALARWPVFIVLFAAAIALGLLAGMLVGRH